MRAIDADEFSKKWEGKIYEGDVRTLLDTAPTIEPRCETCEAFNKTRLLIPQPERKKGKWIEYDNSHCECPFCHEEWSYFDNETEHFNFCPNCGADMREDAEEPKKCDTCLHEREPWSMQCHRCEDFNLWEAKQ